MADRDPTLKLRGLPMTAEALYRVAYQLIDAGKRVESGELQIRDNSGVYIGSGGEEDTHLSVSLFFGPRRTLQ